MTCDRRPTSSSTRLSNLGLDLFRRRVSGSDFRKLFGLGLGFSNKGLGVSASLGFYHSPPLEADTKIFAAVMVIHEV